MFTPLLDKLAEPPPPEGVSCKAWDKILQKGPTKMSKTADVGLIRKTAERLAFEELTAESTPVSTENLIRGELMKCAEDQDLLTMCFGLVADEMFEKMSTDPVLQAYEDLGGTYKHAFGQAMFDVKQMAGSPSVSAGMASRASTRTPQLQSQPVSVTTTTIGQQGQQGGTSAAGGSSAPSTPSAPTG